MIRSLLILCLAISSLVWAKQDDLSISYEQARMRLSEQIKSDPIIGFKAGLTSQAGMEKFKVNTPLAGVLLKSGLFNSNEKPTKIALSHFEKLMLETEIGFIASSRIVHPLTSIEELQSKFSQVAPVIELPDLGFGARVALTGANLVEYNVAAKAILVGTPLPLKSIANINELTTQLTHNNNLVISGNSRDALGDQWQALLWLVNQVVAMGYTIEPSHLLITGALGPMIPAQPGQYAADFTELGQIQFYVQ